MASRDHHRAAILSALAGNAPMAQQIKDIRDHMPQSVIDRGPGASPSDNWSRTAAAAALAFAEKQGWGNVQCIAKFGFNPWIWWARVLDWDLTKRGLMGKECCSLVYDVEHALPAYIAFALADDGAWSDVRDLARQWLKGWLAIKILSSMPVLEKRADLTKLNRRIDGAGPSSHPVLPGRPLFTTAYGSGLRSFSRSRSLGSNFRGGAPHHVWAHPVTAFVAHQLGYPAVGFDGDWATAVENALGNPSILARGEKDMAKQAINGLTGAAQVVAKWLPRTGPVLHIIRWRAMAATVMTEPKGWNGKFSPSWATAPVYAITVDSQGERRILTADGGQRGPGTINIGDAQIDGVGRVTRVRCSRGSITGVDGRSIPATGTLPILPLDQALWHYVCSTKGVRAYGADPHDSGGGTDPRPPDPPTDPDFDWKRLERIGAALIRNAVEQDAYKCQSRVIEMARAANMDAPSRTVSRDGSKVGS